MQHSIFLQESGPRSPRYRPQDPEVLLPYLRLDLQVQGLLRG